MKNIHKGINRYRNSVIKSMVRKIVGEAAWERALGDGLGGISLRNGVYYAVSEGTYQTKMFIDSVVF